MNDFFLQRRESKQGGHAVSRMWLSTSVLCRLGQVPPSWSRWASKRKKKACENRSGWFSVTESRCHRLGMYMCVFWETVTYSLTAIQYLRLNCSNHSRILCSWLNISDSTVHYRRHAHNRWWRCSNLFEESVWSWTKEKRLRECPASLKAGDGGCAIESVECMHSLRVSASSEGHIRSEKVSWSPTDVAPILTE